MELAELEDITKFYGLKVLRPILGSESFCDEIKGRFRDLVYQKEIQDAKHLARDSEEIIASVCNHFEVDRMSLNKKRRGYDNIARDVALHLLRLHRSETLSEIGSYFGLESYSTVSGILLRFKKRLENDKTLQKQILRVQKDLQ